ncbi:hypothetical protein PVL30_003471 [Lodderomyces elongisporus]|uniref:uncharacterized protein n=1 Tax=Lodderomyces elongisporus TaxID=36914 RepID=UPI002924E8B7|nr:uncharacterized protein PVL30_003471 [Lodderomyces elongisporus]WLF79707.1 hypothetical protein PVL30_003471 [Lodderomyces elongisporus]
MSYVPSNYSETTSASLSHVVMFHVLWVENIAKSKVAQLDEWKDFIDPHNASADRIKKSRVIREVRDEGDRDGEATEGDTAYIGNTNGTAIYKLLLRDGFNNFSYAYEAEPLRFMRQENTGTPMPIRLGGRLIVKQGAPIKRGVLFLTHKNCEYKGINPADAALVRTLNDGAAARAIDLLSRG